MSQDESSRASAICTECQVPFSAEAAKVYKGKCVNCFCKTLGVGDDATVGETDGGTSPKCTKCGKKEESLSPIEKQKLCGKCTAKHFENSSTASKAAPPP